MLFGNTNDVLMSQATSVTEQSEKNNQREDTSNEVSENREFVREESVSPDSNGRDSVISDQGYASCGGSVRSRILSIDGESISISDQHSTEYNAVISPCNTSLTDVLNDTYIASNRNSPTSETESTFGQSLDFSPSSSASDQLEKTLCIRARGIENARLTQDEAVMEWNFDGNSPAVNFDDKAEFDLFFDRVLETAYEDLTQNVQTSSIFAPIPTKENHQIFPSSNFTGYSANDSVGVLPLNVEDFCFDSEITEQDTVNAPSPSNDYLQSDLERRQLCNDNTAFMTFNNDEYAKMTVGKRALDDQVFSLTSKPEATSQASETKVSTPTSAEEEAWRSYLENPLTAATTAMMSIHGDEDSAAALGMLYDYYKVPKEKRLLSYPSTIAELKTRTSAAQKTVAPTIVAAVPPTTQKAEMVGILPPITVPKTSQTFEPLQLRASKPAGMPVQRLESVCDIIKKRRPLITNGMKVKEESSDVPQDLSTYAKSGENILPLTYSPSSTSSAFVPTSYTPSVTTDFSALSSLSTPYLAHTTKAPNSSDPMEYVMEAPKSLKQKEGEPTMSYINKGQFYCITLRSLSEQWQFKSPRVKSVIHIVFGDQKPEEEQLRHWKYWHARQHTVKQRIIDIADYKESNMIYEIEEIGHNAISFCWNATEPAKIFISCNCLSTDFSAQKGIKGLPLLLQIDSYVDGQETTAFHRAQCQIKVFCDKGAERKIRDEERKANRKRQKNSKSNSSSGNGLLSVPTPELKQAATSNGQAGQTPLKRTDFVTFKTTTDVATKPVLFLPEFTGHSSISHSISTTSQPANIVAKPPSPIKPTLPTSPVAQPFISDAEPSERSLKRSHSNDEEQCTSYKVPRVSENARVLLYVRQPSDEIYDGLMLETPNLVGLKRAIQEKYDCDAANIKNVFKKSKKGIVVRVDDNIIRHYSNEDTFVIDIRKEVKDGASMYTVTLTEV